MYNAGGDLSSISGSESDSDSNKESEEAKSKLLSMEEEDERYGNDITHTSKPRSSPFLYFSSQDGRYFAVYKNLVINHKIAGVRNSTTPDLLNSLSSLAQPQVWIILMRAGGHFAGAVFRGYVCSTSVYSITTNNGVSCRCHPVKGRLANWCCICTMPSFESCNILFYMYMLFGAYSHLHTYCNTGQPWLFIRPFIATQ